MASVNAENKPKLLQYLKRLAPFSIVDKGITLALDGQVVECSKVNTTISAIVRATETEDFSVTLQVVSSSRVEAHCRCSSREEMEEQWCLHSVAVLWRASDLGFFEPHSGFAATESTFRVNTSSPEEIANVLERLAEGRPLPEQTAPHTHHNPHVQVAVTPSGDRLGLQVYFNQELQEPHFFEQFIPRSSRTLDNLLIQLLEDAGSWDEDGKIWYVNSSQHIDSILGLISEYKDVIHADSGKLLKLSALPLEAHIELLWNEGNTDITFVWNLPSGEHAEREGDLIGTGPFWSMVGETLYKVSSRAAKLAALFPHGPRLTFPRSKSGPILELLSRPDIQPEIVILNPEDTPKTSVKEPTPLLEIWSDSTGREAALSNDALTIEASLEFLYPQPKGSEVYLPHREQENAYRLFLEGLGFVPAADRRRYSLRGDGALDLLSKGKATFPQPWKVDGLEGLLSQVKFADLRLNVSVSKSEDDASSPIDWFHCKVALTQNNATIPLSTLFKSSRREGNRWIRLDSGAYAEVPAGGLSKLQATLGFLDPNFRLSNAIKTRVQPAQALGLLHADESRVEILADKSFDQLARRMKNFSRIETISQPKSFRGKLRTYQTDGISWMNFLHRYELGGILADEMGLGKTVQTLAFLQYLKDGRSATRELKLPVLIVAPTSVIMNWMYEIRRFVPQMKALLLHGAKRRELFASIPEHDIVITSYSLLRLDKPVLQEHQFSYFVLDEAQNIKNPAAATTRAAKSIRAKHRIALTGTPTENRPLELWSIFDFLMPGYLGSSEFFRNHLEKPILEGTDGGQKAAELLAKKTQPFILRRLKAQVEKDLPRKTESELHVPMTPSQTELYVQILNEVRPQVFDAVETKGIKAAGVSILAALLRLRQVCNHPCSIDGLQNVPGLDSGKFELLQQVVLEAVESGRKLLIFSQFREMLRLIREFLDSKGISHLSLDGSTKDRQTLVDKFNSDESVRAFVISLKAGGTGLNLTAADTVIIYDPWWNPAVESQAVDRAHRIGQKKSVTVYRLVTEDSIEQKIMQLKQKKKRITDALIQDEPSASPLQLTKAELEELFQMPSAPEE